MLDFLVAGCKFVVGDGGDARLRHITLGKVNIGIHWLLILSRRGSLSRQAVLLAFLEVSLIYAYIVTLVS